jgi:hypothetical protein
MFTFKRMSIQEYIELNNLKVLRPKDLADEASKTKRAILESQMQVKRRLAKDNHTLKKSVDWRNSTFNINRVQVLVFLRELGLQYKEVSAITGVPMGTLCVFYNDVKKKESLQSFNIMYKNKHIDYGEFMEPLF